MNEEGLSILSLWYWSFYSVRFLIITLEKFLYYEYQAFVFFFLSFFSFFFFFFVDHYTFHDSSYRHWLHIILSLLVSFGKLIFRLLLFFYYYYFCCFVLSFIFYKDAPLPLIKFYFIVIFPIFFKYKAHVFFCWSIFCIKRFFPLFFFFALHSLSFFSHSELFRQSVSSNFFFLLFCYDDVNWNDVMIYYHRF